jgi:hypothetical protein
MACEEADMYYRWQMLEQIAKGEMPAGMTEADLRAMDMPVPGEIELIEKPDGSMVIRKVETVAATTAPSAPVSAKAKLAAKAKAKKSAAKSAGKAKVDAFACDSPDEA